MHIHNCSVTKGTRSFPTVTALKLGRNVSYAWMFMHVKFIVKSGVISVTYAPFFLALNTDHLQWDPFPGIVQL